MEVFIGNLPPQATLLELMRLLEGFELKPPDFQCHEGRDRNDRNYHYFVARAPSGDGRALIARLNGQVFQGNTIEAREYLRRAPCEEWTGEERRLNTG